MQIEGGIWTGAEPPMTAFLTGAEPPMTTLVITRTGAGPTMTQHWSQHVGD